MSGGSKQTTSITHSTDYNVYSYQLQQGRQEEGQIYWEPIMEGTQQWGYQCRLTLSIEPIALLSGVNDGWALSNFN